MVSTAVAKEYSSVFVIAGCPLITTAKTDVPAPFKAVLPVPMVASSDHAVPFHTSVLSVPPVPPASKTAVAVGPAFPVHILAVFKAATSVQDEPSHSSVESLG